MMSQSCDNHLVAHGVHHVGRLEGEQASLLYLQPAQRDMACGHPDMVLGHPGLNCAIWSP
jgi:hypothetical protein